MIISGTFEERKREGGAGYCSIVTCALLEQIQKNTTAINISDQPSNNGFLLNYRAAYPVDYSCICSRERQRDKAEILPQPLIRFSGCHIIRLALFKLGQKQAVKLQIARRGSSISVRIGRNAWMQEREGR